MSKAKHTAWKVKTNVHPETNGDPWGWVGRDVFGSGDAIPGVSITWTGAKGRDIARLIAEAPTLKGYLSSARVVLARMRRSMMAHPDHEAGSEFDDLTTESQILEDEIIELIRRIEG